MADKQPAPQAHEDQSQPGSLWEAQEALLGLLEPEKEKPEKEEAKPAESEESTEETQDELPEEETEEVESEEEESEEEDVSEESDDEEAPEEEDSEPELFTVRINGEDHEVTAEELAKGYSRQSDYTKKTQELSEYRKQLDQAAQFYQNEITQTQEARQHYIGALSTAIETNMSSLAKYESTDWERLKSENMEDYLAKRDEYREAQTNVDKLKQNYQQEAAKQDEEYKQQYTQTIQEEHAKLVSILPAWGEPEKQKAIATEVRDFALSKGYTQEELNQLVDHRSILVLMQAKAWEDSMRKISSIKQKKIKNKPKIAKSGKGTVKSESTKTKSTAKMKRLRQTGHVDDAASLLEDLFNS
jgi:hypothetical protein